MNSMNRQKGKKRSDQNGTLIIQSIPPGEFERESKERLRQATEGKTVPHVMNFEDPRRLRKIFTDKRLDLIEQIQELSPDSIRDLARKVNRGLREIHEDLKLLESYDIVKFAEDGRAKKPVVPYDQIEINVRLLNTAGAVHEETAGYPSWDSVDEE